MRARTRIPTTWRLATAAAVAAVAVAGCTSTTPAGTADTGATSSAVGGGAAAGGQVLPVTRNPITNTSTAPTLSIDSVLVENNVDPVTGGTAPDHLEVALTNTGAAPLSGFEVYYTFTDPTATASESCYTKLPDTFSIPAGGSRVVNFDDTGATDHFAVNKFSLYYVSKNALDVTVQVSATDAAVQETTLKKDAGGAENPGE